MSNLGTFNQLSRSLFSKKARFVDASHGPEYSAAICHNSLSSEVRNHSQDSSETITKLSRLDMVIYVNL